MCQSERQDQHECQTVAESIKSSLSLYLDEHVPWRPTALSLRYCPPPPLLVWPSSTAAAAAAGMSSINLLTHHNGLSKPSAHAQLEYYFFFSFVIDLFLHLADSHLLREGAGAGGVTMLDARLQHCVSVKRQAEPRHDGHGTRKG